MARPENLGCDDDEGPHRPARRRGVGRGRAGLVLRPGLRPPRAAGVHTGPWHQRAAAAGRGPPGLQRDTRPGPVGGAGSRRVGHEGAGRPGPLAHREAGPAPGRAGSPRPGHLHRRLAGDLGGRRPHHGRLGGLRGRRGGRTGGRGNGRRAGRGGDRRSDRGLRRWALAVLRRGGAAARGRGRRCARRRRSCRRLPAGAGRGLGGGGRRPGADDRRLPSQHRDQPLSPALVAHRPQAGSPGGGGGALRGPRPVRLPAPEPDVAGGGGSRRGGSHAGARPRRSRQHLVAALVLDRRPVGPPRRGGGMGRRPGLAPGGAATGRPGPGARPGAALLLGGHPHPGRRGGLGRAAQLGRGRRLEGGGGHQLRDSAGRQGRARPGTGRARSPQPPPPPPGTGTAHGRAAPGAPGRDGDRGRRAGDDGRARRPPAVGLGGGAHRASSCTRPASQRPRLHHVGAGKPRRHAWVGWSEPLRRHGLGLRHRHARARSDRGPALQPA